MKLLQPNSIFIKKTLTEYKTLCETHDLYYSESLCYFLIESYHSTTFIDELNNNAFLVPAVKNFLIRKYCIFRQLY
jgi:hypothetical protein